MIIDKSSSTSDHPNRRAYCMVKKCVIYQKRPIEDTRRYQTEITIDEDYMPQHICNRVRTKKELLRIPHLPNNL